MPRMSVPLHPQTLAGLRPPAPPQNPFAGGGGGPRQRPNPAGAPPPNTLPAFPGNANPGAFAQPAPFNPLLAQTILGMAGSFGPPPMAGGGAMGRGPLGGFGLAQEREFPARRNPYLSR